MSEILLALSMMTLGRTTELRIVEPALISIIQASTAGQSPATQQGRKQLSPEERQQLRAAVERVANSSSGELQFDRVNGFYVPGSASAQAAD